MYKTIKKSRNSGFSKRTNTFEKFRRKSVDWKELAINYPKISEYLTFQPHVNTLHFLGDPTLAALLLFFCAWVSHVMLTGIRKCVLHPKLT